MPTSARFGSGSAGVVVAETTDFTVDATGRFSETQRRAIRVLNVRAAEPYLVAHGEENVDSSVTSIAAWTVAPSGRVVESQKKDVNVTAAFAEFELFSDSKEKYVVHLRCRGRRISSAPKSCARAASPSPASASTSEGLSAHPRQRIARLRAFRLGALLLEPSRPRRDRQPITQCRRLPRFQSAGHRARR